jgi:glycosyltransferase involved in cell wall biosynthesis
MTSRDVSSSPDAVSLYPQSTYSETDLHLVKEELTATYGDKAVRDEEVAVRLKVQLAENAIQLLRAEEKIQSQRAQIAQLTTTFGALRTRIEQRDSRLAAVDEQLRTNGSVIAQLALLTDELQTDLAQSRREFDMQRAELEQQLTHREEEARTQLAEIAILTGTLSEHRSELQKRETEVQKARRELIRQREEIASLCGTVVEHRIQLQERETELEKTDRELARQREEAATLSDALLTHISQMKEREKALEKAGQELERQQVEIRSLRAAACEFQEQLSGLLNSISWQVTAPLRFAARPLKNTWARVNRRFRRPSVPKTKPPAPHNLSYAVDLLRVQGRRIYGWGWMAGVKEIASLKIAARTAAEENTPLGCTYGFGREDVAVAHPFFAGAERSGYVISGWLPDGRTDYLVANVRFKDGSEEVFSIDLPTDVEKPPPFKRMVELRRWARAAYRYLTRGELRILVEKSAVNLASLLARRPSDIAGEPHDVLDLLAASGFPVILVIDHNMGGGANIYREQLVNELRRTEKAVLLLSYDLPSLSFNAKLMAGSVEKAFRLDSLGFLLDVGTLVGIKEIFVNNLVSVNDPLSVLEFLPRLRQFSNASLTVAVHDYFMVCPSWTLLDNRGRFCGIPELSVCRGCLTYHTGEFVNFVRERDLEAWRNKWSECLFAADTILCFSQASAQLVQKAYPKIDRAKFLVKPHVLHQLPDALEFRTHEADLHIGVVGEIREHKGAKIIQEMARLIAKRQLPARITVIGTIDVSCDSAVVMVTGRYRQIELRKIIADSGVNVCLLPSIWPETFSYVTEELIALNLPLAVFNLGAPAERVKNYSKGLIIESIDAEHALMRLVEFHKALSSRSGPG